MTNKYYCVTKTQAPSVDNHAGYTALLIVDLSGESTVAPPLDPVHFPSGDAAENFPEGACFSPGTIIRAQLSDSMKTYCLSAEYKFIAEDGSLLVEEG